VAAALSGGDPLAAALAPGETPSPQMVAAAGGGGRHASAARACTIRRNERRFGLLTLVVGTIVQNMLITLPLTLHFNRWYAPGALTGIAAILAIAIIALRYALAGQQLFSAKALDS
jgi:hypothetical protein